MSLSIVLLAAGEGKRMKTDKPKPLVHLADHPLIQYSLDTAKILKPERIILVTGYKKDEVKKYDNYKLEQLQKNICLVSKRLNNENNIGHNVKISHILGNKFQSKLIKPIIKQDTGFSLTTFKSENGKVNNLKFDKPTILFSQKGKWKIDTENSAYEINYKDTFSVPVGSHVSIQTDGKHESLLNCVSKIK